MGDYTIELNDEVVLFASALGENFVRTAFPNALYAGRNRLLGVVQVIRGRNLTIRLNFDQNIYDVGAHVVQPLAETDVVDEDGLVLLRRDNPDIAEEDFDADGETAGEVPFDELDARNTITWDFDDDCLADPRHPGDYRPASQKNARLNNAELNAVMTHGVTSRRQLIWLLFKAFFPVNFVREVVIPCTNVMAGAVCNVTNRKTATLHTNGKQRARDDRFLCESDAPRP
jgi:hypothetical protein